MALYKCVNGNNIRLTDEAELATRKEWATNASFQAKRDEYEAWRATRDDADTSMDALMSVLDRLDQGGTSIGQEGFEALQRWKAYKNAAIPKPVEE